MQEKLSLPVELGMMGALAGYAGVMEQLEKDR